jgi:ribonuclease HII
MGLSLLQQHDADQLVGHEWLIGIDEAGRGALAGPVVAGACVLGPSFFQSSHAMELSAEVNDSKQLSAEARERYFERIQDLQKAGLLDFAVASASVREIAEHNILGATRVAMQRAVEMLAGRTASWTLPEVTTEGPLFSDEPPVKLIVDGRPLKPFPYTHSGIVKGDGKSLSIAMASIAAKVSRDRELVRLATDYPDYGFDGHKGYATQGHRRAILAHGATPAHRELFLRKILISQDASRIP